MADESELTCFLFAKMCQIDGVEGAKNLAMIRL